MIKTSESLSVQRLPFPAKPLTTTTTMSAIVFFALFFQNATRLCLFFRALLKAFRSLPSKDIT